MNTPSWTEIKQLFAEASELAAEERKALLDRRCAGNPRLRAEVEEYLRHHEQLAARTPAHVDAPVSLEPESEPSAASGAGSIAPTDELVRRLKANALEKRRYKFQGEIARGGMGAILKVWDEDLRRHLAMKVVLGKAGATTSDGTPAVDPQTLGRFLEEAQVTGQLDHPGIVPVHELGLDNEGRVYFTMKLVKGRDLKEIFKLVHAGQDGWNETRALGVILKACEAMAYAHNKGVIHRDLKPANVMVGNFGEVYVMDWGIARVQGRKDSHDLRIAPEFSTELISVRTDRRDEREDAADSPILTRDGDVLGTPAYMAPEQAGGEIEKLGPRSDVYSMGAMIYHLLARHAPYLVPGKRIGNRLLLATLLQGPPAALATVRSDLPQEMVAICEKAMAREASQRYADTLELAEDLRAFLEHRVVGAYETGTWAETRKWVQRNRALAASLAAAMLLLVAGLTTSLVFKVRAEEKELIATQKTNDVLSLSAIQELKELEDRADALWPADPENVPRFEAWLADARVLIEGRAADPAKGTAAHPSLADHEAKLVEIRQRAKPLTAAEIEADRRASPGFEEWENEHAKSQWLRRMLSEEPWPIEAEVEAALAKETLPADANALNRQAWPLVDMDPARIQYGSEVRGLLLARRAVAAASDEERAGIRDTLAWANLRLGRFEQAVAEETQALGEAEDARKAEFEGYLVKLKDAIASWRGDERSQRSREALEVAAHVTELERSVSGRRTFEFEDAGDRWWHVQLGMLVSDLKAFTDEDSGGLFSSGTSESSGWGIVKRAEFARTVAERSVSGAEAKRRWDEAIAAIARSPKYGGLVMTPRIGLLPIGEDPDSHLLEFAHLLTGDPAERGADRKLVLKESMGLVYVLIPGCTFWMGAQATDPHGRNYDPKASGDESPAHEVKLSPYFLSKYEMTQGQWERFTGKNPSQYRKWTYSRNWNKAGKGPSALHPVEQITWTNCMDVLSRMGSELPTEAQWENGCRGGTSSVYWSGDGLEGLGEVANISDAYALEHGGEGFAGGEKDIDDGNTAHAEVGSYRANAYGLHDVHGNVWEWCRDGYADYSAGKQVDPVAPWIGVRARVNRGGSFANAASKARSANRTGDAPEAHGNVLGLRPAMALEP